MAASRATQQRYARGIDVVRIGVIRKPLDRRRVLYGITLMALALILVSWAGNDDATFGILPLWVGLVTLILYHWRDRLMETTGGVN